MVIPRPRPHHTFPAQQTNTSSPYLAPWADGAPLHLEEETSLRRMAYIITNSWTTGAGWKSRGRFLELGYQPPPALEEDLENHVPVSRPLSTDPLQQTNEHTQNRQYLFVGHHHLHQKHPQNNNNHQQKTTRRRTCAHNLSKRLSRDEDDSSMWAWDVRYFSLPIPRKQCEPACIL